MTLGSSTAAVLISVSRDRDSGADRGQVDDLSLVNMRRSPLARWALLNDSSPLPQTPGASIILGEVTRVVTQYHCSRGLFAPRWAT